MTKHITLTLFLLCAVLLANAQKTITVDASKAEQTFKNLKPGEYNVIVKGDLKAVMIRDNYKLRTPWIIDTNNVKINILDLSKCYGKDSIYETMLYYIGENGNEVKPYLPSKIILPNDCKYVSHIYNGYGKITVSPKSKYFTTKGDFLLSKDGKNIIKYWWNNTVFVRGVPSETRSIYKKYLIPNGVETIPDGYFTPFDTVIIPKSVKHIGHNNLFYNWQIYPPQNETFLPASSNTLIIITIPNTSPKTKCSFL